MSGNFQTLKTNGKIAKEKGDISCANKIIKVSVRAQTYELTARRQAGRLNCDELAVDSLLLANQKRRSANQLKAKAARCCKQQQ